MKAFGITSLLFVLACSPSYAQIDGNDAAASLKGVDGFPVVMDIEAGHGITSSPYLSVSNLRLDAVTRLGGRGVPVLNSGAVPDAAPYLYIHVNAMDFGQGLVPFNITVSFLRPARLDGGARVVAATWETSAVGLVSIDRMEVLQDTLHDLLDEFASEWVTVNTSRKSGSRL